MDFCAGIDLLSLVTKQDVFTEEQAQFYVSELAIAIQYIHELGYAHRDIKPDNVLISADGHIKLSDFDLCTNKFERFDTSSSLESKPNPEAKMNTDPKRQRLSSYASIYFGVPDYMSPELFEGSDSKYDERCDWWSMGVIFYELVAGEPPFYVDEEDESERSEAVQGKIKNYENMTIDPEIFSTNAMNLILQLLCDQEKRLTFDQIRTHKFFGGVPWDDIRSQTPPFKIPVETDFQNDEKDVPKSCAWPSKHTPPSGRDKANFQGYSYCAPPEAFLEVRDLAGADTSFPPRDLSTPQKPDEGGTPPRDLSMEAPMEIPKTPQGVFPDEIPSEPAETAAASAKSTAKTNIQTAGNALPAESTPPAGGCCIIS